MILRLFKRLLTYLGTLFILILVLAGMINAADPDRIGSEYFLGPAAIRLLTGAEYERSDKGTVAWDCNPEASYYEVKIVWLDPSQPVEYNLGHVTQCEITILKPRTGHFKAMVRACKVVEAQTFCSEWSDSTSNIHGVVNGQPMGWWIFWEPGLPSQIVVEDTEE